MAVVAANLPNNPSVSKFVLCFIKGENKTSISRTYPATRLEPCTSP